MRTSFLAYLLSTAAAFAPPGDPPAGGGGQDDQTDDDHIEFQDEDDQDNPPGEGDEDQDDDSDDHDDGAEDDQDDGQDGGGQQPPASQSRGRRQYGDLRRQARERAEENARLTRQLADMQRDMDVLRQQHTQAPPETAAQRAERLALLSPEERAMEMVNEALERNNRTQQQLTSQLMDQSDRTSFEARASVNPLFKKLSAEVERELAQLRQKGQNLPRETIATYLIGQRVVAQQGRPRPGAQQRRRSQEARPVRSQGDVGASRQRRGGQPVTAKDYEDRFGDIPI